MQIKLYILPSSTPHLFGFVFETEIFKYFPILLERSYFGSKTFCHFISMKIIFFNHSLFIMHCFRKIKLLYDIFGSEMNCYHHHYHCHHKNKKKY